MALVIAQACVDCGDLTDRAHLFAFYGRVICATCLREETDRVKRDAEIWILERLFTLEAAV